MDSNVSNSGEFHAPSNNLQHISMCADCRDASVTEMTLAYLGGFFDGEGCIHLAKQTFKDPMRRATFRMRLVIGQNNLEILEYFAQEVGVTGKIHRIARTRAQNRQCYALIFDGATAFEVLRKLLPYLRRKLPEALVALEYEQSCAVHVHPGRRGIDPNDWALRARFYRKLRAMK
jgi:hypothetical protein